MKANAIQICGTGSGVGKSVINAALCRIFFQDGYRVAPFKSQNMALNSFVTENGEEIGRAQALQALACGIKPAAEINPILIKPSSDRKAQIILMGHPVRSMSVYEYKNYKKLVIGDVKRSLKKLMDKFEIVVIEGAGSPAEVNLKSHDLVNMKIAKLAGAPVILVGDIDKGGVFAWLIGTLQLLTAEEKKMVKGIIINKFRGDKRLLMPGIRFLEKYTGIKVLGIIPYFRNINIPEEDSLPIESRREEAISKKTIKIDVIYLPHISNFTDFDALKEEPDVSLKYIKEKGDISDPDVIIIPGTKNTIEDLNYLWRSGLADKILLAMDRKPSTILIGICGGYQMLGKWIYDMAGIESKKKKIKGLGRLPIITRICHEKILSQIKARHIETGTEVKGYEIHHGRTKFTGKLKPVFEITIFKNRRVKRYDGAITPEGRCWGTYIHGLFDSDGFRRNFLNRLRRKKGLSDLTVTRNYSVDKEINKLADLVRNNIDVKMLYRILSGKGTI